MTPYIPIICFVAGLILGVGVICLGLALAFRASVDIRKIREGIEETKGDFELAENEPKENESMQDME